MGQFAQFVVCILLYRIVYYLLTGFPTTRLRPENYQASEASEAYASESYASEAYTSETSYPFSDA